MAPTPPPLRSKVSLPDSLPGGLASPPYERQNAQEALPPVYASQSNLAAQDSHDGHHLLRDAALAALASGDTDMSRQHSTDHAYPPESRSRQSGLHDHSILADSSNNSSRPGIAGPRVAITDPLADFRDRNLPKPSGLGPKSDYPPHETNRTPGTFNYDRNVPYRPPLLRQDSEVSSTDGGDRDYGEFNWSDEEDLDEAARFENEQAKQVRMGRLSLWKILNFLATTFLGNLIISCCMLIPVIVIQYVYRKRGPDEGHRDFVADNVQAWFIWAAFNLHVEWWIHILVELFPKAVLGLIQLVWGRPSQRVLSLAEYFNAIKPYVKLLCYAALGWGSWAIIFNSIYGLYSQSDPRNSRARYLYRIYQVIQFIFFFTLTICVEKVIIKHIAMSFHRSAYADRIAKVTKSLKVFDWLRDHKPKLKGRDNTSAFGFPRSARGSPSASGAATPVHPTDFSLEGDEKDSRVNTPQSKSSWLKKHSKKRPSDQAAYAGTNDRAIDPATGKPAEGQAPARGDGKSNIIARVAARGGRRVRATAGQASTLARVAMNDPFGLLRNEALGIGTDVNSPAEAKRLARSIFVAFRGSHKRSYLIPSDFEPAYTNADDAEDAFSVFDRDGNGDISQSEIKNTVMQVYKERRFLSRSMQDVNHAVGQLDAIFIVVCLVIIMFEALAIFNVDIGKTLTTFYSLAIAFAFVFKESAANVFDSIIFIFVTHPFDTGDRIQIGEAVLVVKHMSLLSCLFTDSLNQDVYISNVILSATSIVNMRRSGYQWEAITAQFDFNTPLEKLDAVEADMIHWLQTEPERLFVPSTAIVPQKIEYMRSLECTIGMTHADTWQDWGRRFYRKNAFFAAFSFYCKKHGVRYANPVQPIVYWTEDAAQLPPSYDTNTKGAADEEDNGYVLDDFTPSPYSSPQIRAAGGAVALPPKKYKSYMNFTPPPDELEGDAANVRARKAKREAKKFANQGGDG